MDNNPINLNDVLGDKTHGDGADELPLKQFVKCSCCGTSMTGYEVKKKNLFYYKCNKTGCKKNRSQKVMHAKFEGLLENYSIDGRLYNTVKDLMTEVLSRKLKTKKVDTKSLKQTRADLVKKSESIEERYVIGELDKNMFSKYSAKFKEQISQIDSELTVSKKSLSNLEKAIDKCMDMSLKLPSMWVNSNYVQKRKLQFLLFPDGISYDRKNDDYRTTRINLVFDLMAYLAGFTEGQKNGDSVKIDEIPTWVGPPGLEPGTF